MLALMEQQRPATFEQWVLSLDEDDQDSVHQALDLAYRTSSYRPAYEVLHRLDENPWTGGIDALRNYAIRKFGA